MKILTIHADFIEFVAKKKALKEAEKADKKPHRVEECLVVFTAVEKVDEKNPDAVIKRYLLEIRNVAQQLSVKTIVLYPYAHLSSSLASPKVAQKIMQDAEKELAKDKKFEVARSPFGWYKSFNIKTKGHPMSELAREFSAEDKEKGEVSEALKAEEKMISHWHVLDVDGKLNKIEFKDKKIRGFDFNKWKNLNKFASYEMAKVRVANEEPPHVRYMKKLQMVDYEPGSDPGHLRFYPKGRFVKGLLERYTTRKVKEYGGMEIEAPLMYDFEHPSLKSYLNRFPARQYTIQTPNKKVFLRFAACFGQFLQMHDAQISYKHLPVWLYEMTRSSFRVEQHGELTGLRRLRAFTMPDVHAFCADMEQAKEEFMKRFQMCIEIEEGIGFKLPDELELAIRITKDFWEKNQDFIKGLVEKWGKPALIEMWDKRFFYFSVKYELNFVDALDKCSALSTDQIDIENAERYDITYVDEKAEKKHPLILHCSPPGAIERVMYALLEKAAIKEKAGKPPMLPLWLAPTQVRLIPVSIENHLEFSKGIVEEFAKLNIRADVDDRVESVGKRIRESAKEWIPYTLVVGDNEIKDEFKQLMVRDREKKEEYKLRFDELVDLIKKQTKDMPYDTLPLPRMLSKRISFVG